MNARPVDLFRLLSSGVYVVGVAFRDQRDAFTAAWMLQVSFQPLLVALSVNPASASYPLLEAAGAFAASVLRSDQLDLARHFGTRSGRDTDKLVGQRWRPGIGGAPVLLDAVAYLECRILEEHPAGDHRLLIARATGGRVLAQEATPMSYHDTGDMDGSAELYPADF